MIVQTELLARNLAALRRANGFTLEEVAVRVGTTRQAVGKWELGESLPDLPHTAALAELYGVTMDALVSHDESALGYPVPPKVGSQAVLGRQDLITSPWVVIMN